MTANFPRILTLLRKERGISQKQAAMELGVSQALLSHYEKGLRECGLEFMIKVAEYYHVSCDYLLGRTSDKSGAMIAVDEIPEEDPAIQDKRLQAGSVLPTLNKKLIVNSLQVLFDLLRQCDNKALTADVSNCLIQTIYMIYRRMYDADPKNPRAMFSAQPDRYMVDSLSSLSQSLVDITRLAAGHAVNGKPGVEQMPALLPDDLTAQYPALAQSLLSLLRRAEEEAK